ncbi:ABC transporter permease subunit [Bacillus licheniformis]|nr:ABC transporter permease subunit [Bacillus licheniformis]
MEIDPFPSAIIAFSLNVGAYASEIIRASILSVPKGQWEAAYSIGMTQKTALTRVILPQAVRVSIPPLSIYYSIPLAILSFIFGMIIALITALARMSKSRILRAVFGIYVSAIRGTPLLVQLFIIFYLFPAFQVTSAKEAANWLTRSTPR